MVLRRYVSIIPLALVAMSIGFAEIGHAGSAFVECAVSRMDFLVDLILLKGAFIRPLATVDVGSREVSVYAVFELKGGVVAAGSTLTLRV